MSIGVLLENFEEDKRLPISPDVVKLFVKKGINITIEDSLHSNACFTKQDFTDAGASFAKKEDIFKQAILIKLSSIKEEDINLLNTSHTLICNSNTLSNKEIATKISNQGAKLLALELIPRISRAQSMDILSSQSSLAGYHAAIHAAYLSGKVMPMMMTSAGTIAPAKVFIVGVGVAGLQAIATAKRLGCVVTAYDVRPETKEQTESLGAKFLEVEGVESSVEKNSVYAKEMTDEYKIKEREMLLYHISKQDIVITTALIMGKKAPLLIDKEMISVMKDGSTIIDLAAEGGGNCFGTKLDETVTVEKVQIVGERVVQKIPQQASMMFAKNIFNFISPHITDTKEISFNEEDEIIKGSLICVNKQVVHPLLNK